MSSSQCVNSKPYLRLYWLSNNYHDYIYITKLKDSGTEIIVCKDIQPKRR